MGVAGAGGSRVSDLGTISGQQAGGGGVRNHIISHIYAHKTLTRKGYNDKVQLGINRGRKIQGVDKINNFCQDRLA